MKIQRNILLNPGPATTTDTVKLAQLVPDICPREKEFAELLSALRQDLLKIVHGDPEKYTCVLFCGSGTLNMDVCLNSLLPADKKILIINNGTYSSRGVEICQYYNLPFIEMRLPFDEIVDFAELEKLLQENPDIYLVYTTHQETVSGLLNPIREIGALVHKYQGILVVDTTSTYALLPLDIEQDNIDFCMASAQKGIQAMTGLSYIIGSIAEIEASRHYPKRSYYCNLYLQYDFFKKNGEMHFTPPVQTIYAAKQALQEYFAEGETAKYHRHLRVHETILANLARLGFKTILPKEKQAGLVAAVKYPDDENWDFFKIHDYCYQRGFTIYPGRIAATNSFRLCSLGAIDVIDIENFFVVFEAALRYYQVSLPIRYN